MPNLSFCKKMCSMAVIFGSEVHQVSSNLILDFIFKPSSLSRHFELLYK